MPLAPWKNLFAPVRKDPQVASESQRFESSFCALSRVNDSLKQNKSCPKENRDSKCPQKYRPCESETGTRAFFHFSSRLHPSRRGEDAAPQDKVFDPHGEERGNAARLEPYGHG